MNNSSKIFFLIKTILSTFTLLIVILFFYAAFFYEPISVEEEIVEEDLDLIIEKEKEKLKKEEEELKKKVSESEEVLIRKLNVKTSIKDGIFATVGNVAITTSDILNEIKIILILNNLRFSEEKKDELQKMAITSKLKRTVKEIEIEKRKDFLNYSSEDLNKELKRLASNIKINVETLKKICELNDLDFSLIENNVKTELLWNSLIYALYRDKLIVNSDEVEDQLKIAISKKDNYEYLVSEIIIKPVEKAKIESRIKEIKDKIKIEGFKNVAISESIAPSSVNGGDLGWLNQNSISKKYLSKIADTLVGNLSERILLPNGILIFKVRDKRKVEKNLDLEDIKNQIVNSEKNKILNMYSVSHYDNVKRSITLRFFNE